MSCENPTTGLEASIQPERKGFGLWFNVMPHPVRHTPRLASGIWLMGGAFMYSKWPPWSMWSSANSLWHTFSRLKGGGQKEKLYPGLDAFSVLFSGFWCFFYLWANGARLVSNYWWPHLSTSGAARQRLFWVQLRVRLANQPSLDIRPPFDFISFQSDRCVSSVSI